MTAGAVVGGAVLAVLLVAVPSEPDPAYTADCTETGTAVHVQPDTRVNRAAADDWCAELLDFQNTEQFQRAIEDLWER